jgi:hypothetical protein
MLLCFIVQASNLPWLMIVLCRSIIL